MAGKRTRGHGFDPITFVPVEQVFKPQVKVRAVRDLNGWADREKRVKWHIPIGRIGHLDEDVAREFHAKGFVQIIEGEVKPVSEMEAEEFRSQVTTIGLGADNG